MVQIENLKMGKKGFEWPKKCEIVTIEKFSNKTRVNHAFILVELN